MTMTPECIYSSYLNALHTLLQCMQDMALGLDGLCVEQMNKILHWQLKTFLMDILMAQICLAGT